MAEAAGQLLRDFFTERRAGQRAQRALLGEPELQPELLPVPEVIESEHGDLR